MKNTVLSIIIPLYNEEKTIGDLLRKVSGADIGKREKDIIVINDGPVAEYGIEPKTERLSHC